MLTSLKEARLTGRGSQVTTIHRPKTTGSPWHILSLCFCAQHTSQLSLRPGPAARTILLSGTTCVQAPRAALTWQQTQGPAQSPQQQPVQHGRTGIFTTHPSITVSALSWYKTLFLCLKQGLLIHRNTIPLLSQTQRRAQQGLSPSRADPCTLLLPQAEAGRSCWARCRCCPLQLSLTHPALMAPRAAIHIHIHITLLFCLVLYHFNNQK